MGGCNLYSFQNTGTTIQYVTGETCSSFNCVIPIQVGDTYWGNFNSGTISKDPDISETEISTIANIRYLSFSSVCSTDAFYFRVDISDLPLSPFTVGDYYCFEEVFNCDLDTPINYQGCFKYMSFSDIVPTSPYVTDVVFKMPPLYSGSSSTTCLSTCPCEPYPCDTNYCITGTGTEFDGNYEYGGQFSGNSYWTGDTTPPYFIYNNGDEWCLSTSLGGPCSMVGAYPCISTCPDICEHYLVEGICPTPTPTPTINCDVLDFQALFDCEFTPTPSITPTNTQTPTVTPTPTSTEPCGYIDISASISGYTPTPTPTPTKTPTPSPEVIRPFTFSGDVTFSTINVNIKCPNSLKFQDCYNGALYYTIDSVSVPSSQSLEQYMIFKSTVDNEERCISYLGIDNNVIGVNKITLIEGPLGFSNLGECVNCVLPQTPTPTPTSTNTPTPTPTLTPTPTSNCICYSFKCNSDNPDVGCRVQYTPCGTTKQDEIYIPSQGTAKLCISPNSSPILLPSPSQFTVTQNGFCPTSTCK
jgi:hypothetical protein